MDKKETKKTIIGMVKGIVLAGLLAFGLYIISSIPINLFLYHEDYTSERDFTPVYFIMLLLYVIANYIVYIRKTAAESEVGKGGGSFDLASDVISYIKGDGKYLFIIYGVMAVIFEAFYLFAGGQSFAAMLVFFFPLAAIIPIPVIRTVIAYAALMLLLLAVTELERYRKFKYWHMK